MNQLFINSFPYSTINQLQSNFNDFIILIKNIFDLGKSCTFILFIFILLCFISFGCLEDQCQLNLADTSKPDDQNTQGQGESAKPEAAESSKEPSTNNEGGQAVVEPSNEQQGNTNQNESSTERQGNFIQPPVEEPTIGEQAGLTAYEEGLLTMFLNRSFKRNKQTRRR